MKEVVYNISDDLAPYVNCVMTGKNTSVDSHTNIPLYADGYPGIMFQQAENGFFMLPKKKKLSELFLYGQTIRPISLDVRGQHSYVVVQLYPFASKYLLGVDPRILNEDCYDLLQIHYIAIENYRLRLINAQDIEEQVQIILELMLQLIQSNQVTDNDKIEKAISIIIDCQGQIKIKDILDQIYMTERTFERNFMSNVGLTPKQFAKIIQFQSSINKLTQSRYDSLLDIGLDSGFSDQSHFIRTFKRYTGQTPSYYLNQIK
ncbi:helix-turn-helix domain-containing protein [Aquimarina aquimarini]|uniref:helix-turn-helix domain-containing protein n=1 Tax=Aquimarina aquimarini TaxID=1191734 RepID=UPI000D55382F|nr:helix-turn-helix transcriptional regulator [Aquimarina aquimarini]